MSTMPMATRPKPAPCTMPTTMGRATVSAMIMAGSESRLERAVGVVLILAAVGLQHVHRRASKARLGEVGDRVHTCVEGLADHRLNEALAGQVPARRLQLEGQQF